MKRSTLSEKCRSLKRFLLYIKMDETTYYRWSRKTVLNRTKDYYKNNKEVFREKANDKYRELSEEDKNVKREYGRNRYKNISDKKKERPKEYQEIIVKLIKLKNYDFLTKDYINSFLIW